VRAVGPGVFAAGDGRRFKEAGVSLPKPLVPVAGKALLGWVLEGYRRAGLVRPAILLNTRGGAVRDWGDEAFAGLRPRWLFKDTASTLESFCVLAGSLRAKSFLFSTVDAVCPPEELVRFASEAPRAGGEIVLGVTRRVDETSLRVVAGPDGRARELVKGGSGPLATAGLYWFTPRLLAEARRALRGGCPSLSRFLGSLPGLGLAPGLVELERVFDVDRPEDAAAAEALLA
jgi:1L-myo-inositol 1-phosphate cytidylyltransferase / CDP-L-myo-inositol myo-inositolphosphotransferase